ncbi:MAG TPA: hypothetical protein VJQ56_01960 [Blastocatellia bacterium]|nr:hypothetical protein [Blastocatellia bacterium]
MHAIINRVTMEIETFNAMNESIYLNLIGTVETIMLIIALLSIAGFAVYLAGIAWVCFDEMRQPSRQQTKPVPDTGEQDRLARLAGVDEPGDNPTGGVWHRKPALTSRAQAARF